MRQNYILVPNASLLLLTIVSSSLCNVHQSLRRVSRLAGGNDARKYDEESHPHSYGFGLGEHGNPQRLSQSPLGLDMKSLGPPTRRKQP